MAARCIANVDLALVFSCPNTILTNAFYILFWGSIMMHLNIATRPWRLELVHGWIELDGTERRGVCDCDNLHIRVSDQQPPDMRLETAWHEIGHAWRGQFDIRPQLKLTDEAYANLVGLGMSSINSYDAVRIRLYMMEGIAAHDFIKLPGLDTIIPVLHCTMT